MPPASNDNEILVEIWIHYSAANPEEWKAFSDLKAMKRLSPPWLQPIALFYRYIDNLVYLGLSSHLARSLHEWDIAWEQGSKTATLLCKWLVRRKCVSPLSYRQRVVFSHTVQSWIKLLRSMVAYIPSRRRDLMSVCRMQVPSFKSTSNGSVIDPLLLIPRVSFTYKEA